MLLCKVYAAVLVCVFSKSMCNGNIADDLTKRYNDLREKCVKNGKTKPAYQCSGIIIRGVPENSQNHFAWSLKPSNRKKESFSAAFLRKDMRFSSFLNYDSGLIIYPHLKTPRKKNTYKVFCAFPVFGHTDGRAGQGCGESHRRDDRRGTSGQCDKQGITSFKKWLSHYEKIVRARKYFVRSQCSFDMTTKSAAADFVTVIKANTHLRKKPSLYAFKNNELVIHSWNEKRPEKMPIEAFFYLRDTSKGYQKAATYQDEFYKTSGEKVPIVSIRLPTRLNPKISIKYKNRKPKEPKVICKDNVSKDSGSKDALPEDIISEDTIPDNTVSKDAVIEATDSEEDVVKEEDTEEDVTEEDVTEEDVTEEDVTEGDTEEVDTEEEVSKEKVSDEVSEENVYNVESSEEDDEFSGDVTSEVPENADHVNSTEHSLPGNSDYEHSIPEEWLRGNWIN